MASQRRYRSSRPQRAGTQKVNVVSKASIRMLNPAYAMGVSNMSDDELSRDVDTDDVYGGCETSDDGEGDNAADKSYTSSSNSSGHGAPFRKNTGAKMQTYTPMLPAFSASSTSGSISADNALGLQTTETAAAKRDTNLTLPTGNIIQPVQPPPASILQQPRVPQPQPQPLQLPEPQQQAKRSTRVISPTGSSLSRFFTWKRGKSGKTPPSNTVPLPKRTEDQPFSAPAHITTFGEAAAAAAAAQAQPSSRRFKAHLNDLHKSYAIDNRFFGDNFFADLSPLSSSSESTSLPATPMDLPAVLPSTHTPLRPGQHVLGRKSSVPTLREVRKATVSPIQQHQALTMQRFYVAAKGTAGTPPSSTVSPPQTPGLSQFRPTPLSPIESIPSSSSGFSLASSGPSRVSSVGRGTRKPQFARNDSGSVRLLPETCFSSSCDDVSTYASSSSSSLWDSVSSSSAQQSPGPRRTPRRKRSQSQPRRPSNAPPLPKHDMLSKRGPPGQPLPPVPQPSSSCHQKKPSQQRRRSKSVDASFNSVTGLSPSLNIMSPGSPLSPTLECLMDEADTFWPDFMHTDVGSQRRSRRQTRLVHEVQKSAILADSEQPRSPSQPQTQSHPQSHPQSQSQPQPPQINVTQLPEDQDGSEVSVAQQAQRVNLAGHGTVVGVSSPRIVCFSPRIGTSNASDSVAGSPRPTSAMSTATVQQATYDHSSPLLSPYEGDDKRASSASTVRPQSPSDGASRANSLLDAPVVNVMPPTPDMSVGNDGFGGSNAGACASQELDAEHEGAYAAYEPENEEELDEEASVLGEPHDQLSASLRDPAASAIESQVSGSSEMPQIPLKSANGVNQRFGHARTRSSVSETGTENNWTVADDEPFGFARSLSNMTLDSVSSEEDSNDDETTAKIANEVDGAVVGNAQIVSVASPPSSGRFQRPQLVSPSAGSLASLPSGTSLALAFLTSPPRSRATPPRSNETPSSLPGLSPSAPMSVGSSLGSSDQQSSLRYRMSSDRPRMPSLTSGESLASVMTTSTSILDYGSEMTHDDMVFGNFRDDFGSPALSPPVRRRAGKEKSDDSKVGNYARLSGGGFGELSSRTEVQKILSYVGVSPPSHADNVDEDDCETPRLSDGGFSTPYVSSESVSSTRPLNVRKFTREESSPNTEEKLSTSADGAPANFSSATMAKTRSSPGSRSTGLSPSSRSAYPRDENTASPHLELDLSLPLDLHGIGLGVEVSGKPDKPRRRGPVQNKPAAEINPAIATRSLLPLKSCARSSRIGGEQRRLPHRSGSESNLRRSHGAAGGRLLGSAMDRSKAMGLGLDFGSAGPEDGGGSSDRSSTSSGSSGSNSSGSLHAGLSLDGESPRPPRFSAASLRSSRALHSAAMSGGVLPYVPSHTGSFESMGFAL